jgi:hypothetical protein
MSDELLPLSQAARWLRVPTRWLRAEAEAGRLPSLDAGGRRLFNLPAVEKVLAKRASNIMAAPTGTKEASHA